MKNALDITMTRASGDDVEAVLEVVQDATRRMQQKGITHWRLYLTDAGVERVRQRVAGASGEEVYLARRAGDDRAVGAVSIEWSDREYWSECNDDQLAGYIHMLCVHRLARGMRLGEHIMRWAERFDRLARPHFRAARLLGRQPVPAAVLRAPRLRASGQGRSARRAADGKAGAQ